MKKSFLLLIFLSVSLLTFDVSLVYSQQPTQEWVRRYTDTSSVNWGAGSIKTDSLGYIYVLAETGNDFGFLKYDRNGNLLLVVTHWPGGYPYGGGTNFDVTPAGDVYITGSVNEDFLEWIYTAKFNTNGILQWGKFYNIDNSDGANDIKIDNSGNVIIAGGSVVGYTNFALLIKYNSIGDTLWTKHFNNGQNDADFNKLAFDNANNIYLTGYLKLPSKCLAMKYSPNGNLDWFTMFSIDTSNSNMGSGIALDGLGNIYILGTQVTSPYGNIHDYLLKMTVGGSILWNKVFTGLSNGGYMAGPVVSINGGSIYYITMSDNGLGGGSYSLATLKYNSAGDSQWVNMYNGGGVPGTGNFPGNIRLDKYDNIYVCGSAYFQSTHQDFITIKYSPAGTQQWVAAYTGITTNGHDGATDLLIDTSLNVYVTGGSLGLISQGVSVTIKYNQVVGITSNNNQIPETIKLYQNYPNPFNPTTKIRFDIPNTVGVAYMRPVQMNLYDILGRKIATLVNTNLKPGEYETQWDASNFASGVYFYALKAGDYTASKKMVLIK